MSFDQREKVAQNLNGKFHVFPIRTIGLKNFIEAFITQV